MPEFWGPPPPPPPPYRHLWSTFSGLGNQKVLQTVQAVPNPPLEMPQLKNLNLQLKIITYNKFKGTDKQSI